MDNKTCVILKCVWRLYDVVDMTDSVDFVCRLGPKKETRCSECVFRLCLERGTEELTAMGLLETAGLYRPSSGPTLCTRHDRVGSSSPLHTWTRRHAVSGKLSGLSAVRVDGQCPECQLQRQYLCACCISKRYLFVKQVNQAKIRVTSSLSGYCAWGMRKYFQTQGYIWLKLVCCTVNIVKYGMDYVCREK